MLIEFSVENVHSFKDRTVFTTKTFNNHPDSEHFGINTFADENTEQNHVKSSMLIGKNAGGKSNFVDALILFRSMILRSFHSKNIIKNVTPFRLHDSSKEEPSKFSMEFAVSDVYYTYGFWVRRGKIEREYLKRKKKAYRLLFERTSSDPGSIDMPKKHESSLGKLREHTKEHVLFLSVLAQFNVGIATEIQDYFSDNYVVLTPDYGMAQDLKKVETERILFEKDNELKVAVTEFLKTSDLGISGVEVRRDDTELPEKVKKFNQLLKEHFESDVDIPDERFEVLFKVSITDEDGSNRREEMLDSALMSGGTNRLFDILGAIFYVLHHGGVLLIDEIENKLHHALVARILDLFNSLDKNPNNAQLVFTTHDLLLLDEDIRRDQVWLVDKDKRGQSRLINLNSYLGVTKKTRILKEYLLGMYDAVPDFDA